MTRVLPFIELTAFVGFTAFSPETKVIRDFISEAIEDPEDLYVWVDYMKGMADELASGALASNDLIPQQEIQKAFYALTTLIVADALAKNLWDELQTVTVENFIKMIKRVEEPPNFKGGNTFPQLFTDALNHLNKMDPASKMADLKHTPDAVRSLMVVYSAGQEAAMKRLRNHQGFVTLNNKPTEAEFLKMLADFDIAKLTDAQALGFGKILKGFDVKEGVAKSGYAHRTSHGATHEFFDIHKYADEIAEIQFRKVIETGSDKTLFRVYDYVLKNGWHVDKKAWKPESIEKWFKASAKGNVIVKGSAKTGQLFRDIIAGMVIPKFAGVLMLGRV